MFHLQDGKIMSCCSDLKTVLIDASEQPVEHQKKSRLSYSGKKKCFTQKVQIIADVETGEILSSNFCDGRTHDFRLFKESGTAVQPHVLILADAGCQGISKINKNSRTPFKRKKGCPLSEEEKKESRDLSKQRITVEHIFRKLKIFRIFRETYRNRRKRFGLRFNLIAACCNFADRLSL